MQKGITKSYNFKGGFYIYAVRKITAIALLVLFASTNEVGQILKLPLLITHYIDHYREEGQSLSAFFHEHYVHHHGNNNYDEDEDNRLPFKTISLHQIASIYLVPIRETINKQVTTTSQEKLILPSIFIPSDFLKDIFHPPQTV